MNSHPTHNAASPSRADQAPWLRGNLQVSKDARYLEHADGTPFLWIGDTAWELFYRLAPTHPEGHDLDAYLSNRSLLEFTVIQAVLLDELDYKSGKGCAANGSMPLVDRDPTRPVEAYWQWVDHVVTRAQVHGLYLAMLPAWGSWVNNEAIFTNESAYAYGKFLGERYKDHPNIIWMLGGDRKVEDAQKQIWNAMARGIREAVGRNHVMTFHPAGARSSSSEFHGEDWLDFNTYQSGHSRDGSGPAALAARDFALKPAKPTLNSEPCYEGVPERFWENPTNPRMTDHHVRKDTYRSILAGSFGITHGHSSIWQMLRPGDTPVAGAEASIPWYDAMHAAGAAHMRFVGRLLKSRPPQRKPDPSLVQESLGKGPEQMAAARGANCAFIYFPQAMTRTINLGKIGGERVRCAWYNTRTGDSISAGEFANSGQQSFTPPGELDWVLVVDDTAAGYAAPGAVDLWYGLVP